MLDEIYDLWEKQNKLCLLSLYYILKPIALSILVLIVMINYLYDTAYQCWN